MSDCNICLICLCRGGKMYSCKEYNLRLYYKEIMPLKVTDGLPQHFCYLCAAMLFKFHKFKEKCHTGHKILKDLLSKGPITSSSISQINREKVYLQSTIDIMALSKRVKSYSIEDKSIDINMDEHSYALTDYDSDKSLKYENIAEVPIELDQVSDVDEKKIDIDELQINVEKEKITSEVQKSNSTISGSNVTRNVSKTVKTQQPIKKITTRIQKIVKRTFDQDMIKNEVVYVQEKVDSDEERKHIDNRKGKRRAKRKPQEISVATVRKIERREAEDTAAVEQQQLAIKPKQKQLNPEHWLKITMTEEEAMTKFKERAHNNKYLLALYKCVLCYKVFSKEDILIRHTNLVHCESRGTIVCNFCRRRFKTKSMLRKHKPVHYNEFKCLRCDLVFNLEDAASRHDDLHSGTVKVCGKCGMQFRHLTTYYSHLRVYHRSEHVCTLCGASFVSQKGLLQHKNLKHGNTEITPEEGESTYCERCDMKFETKQAYEEHFHQSIKHADVIEAKTDKLEEDTDEESDNNLPALISLKGKITNPNPHLNNQNKSRGSRTCSVCGQVFPSYYRYRLHHRAEHKDIPVPVAYTSMCDVCGATIKSNNIANHMNIHTRSKMFPCPTCGMQFTLKANMVRHNLTHTIRDRSQYSFKCPMCEKRFTQKGSMQLHYRTKHLKEPYPKRNRRKKTILLKPALLEDTSGHTDDNMH